VTSRQSFFCITLFIFLIICLHLACFAQNRQYKKIKNYADAQMIDPGSVHKIGSERIPPQFVVLFLHGFLGFNKFSGQDSWNEYAHKMVPGLDGLSYLVYHPGLIQTKDVQSFAQDSDVYQAKLHLSFLADKVSQPKGLTLIGNYDVSGLPIVCVGHSNGGSTLISLLSQHHLLAKKIKGAVLLAPYADLSAVSTIEKTGRWIGDVLARIGAKMLFAPSYNPFGNSPVLHASLGNFPKDLPLLIVSNRNDRVVYFKNRELLSRAFTSHEKYKNTVQFLDLDTGGHNWGWRRISMPSLGCFMKKTTLTSVKPIVRISQKTHKYATYLRYLDRVKFKNTILSFIKKNIVDN
jgi:predicted esterase